MLHFLILSQLALAAIYHLSPEAPIDPSIKHIVVLMFENRSFDSFLGRLKLDGLNADINGPTLNEFNVLNDGSKVMLRNATVLFKDDIDKYDPVHEVVALLTIG